MSIGFVMGGDPVGGGWWGIPTAGNRPTMLPKADSLGRQIDRKHRPDQVPARHRAPLPAVAGLGPVVAHHEVLPCGHVRGEVPPPTALRLDVRLLEPLAVHPDDAVSLLEVIAGKADEPLHEGLPGAAALEAAGRRGRRLEHDDLAALRIAEAIDETVREHPVRETRHAPRRGLRAMERGLHRGRGNAVRVDDPGLDGKHRPDGHDDRDDPVDDRRPRVRQALGQPVDRPSHWNPTTPPPPCRARPHSDLSLLCSRRHVSMRAWSPESRMSGTLQPLNSGGRVYCGYSRPPSSSAEKLSSAPLSSRRAPGSRRATASRTTMAGSSPPESTYGPIEIASVAMCSTMRSSKPSKRADSSVSASSFASSSTSSWSSCVP